VDIFVNSVFVYDDKITITFNYSGDNRTITLYEVEAAAASVREPSDMGHHVVADFISFATTFYLKSHLSLIPSLLLSQSQPLRWVAIGF